MNELNNLKQEISSIDDYPMFDGIQGDMVVRVDSRVFKAHKRVLRKCPFFAAVVDGDWQESQNSEVTLQGFSQASVQFAIEHLYVPKKMVSTENDLVELVAISDMLGLQSLLLAVCATMTSNICHNFHKPCQECIGGVVSTLQVAHSYGLVDLRKKCIDWLAKHFTKTWNSKAFAGLSETLQLNCLELIRESMLPRNIIEIALDCQKLQDTLPSVKWVQSVDSLAKQLSASCMLYLQQHFDKILNSPEFYSIKEIRNAWDLCRIEKLLLDAAVGLPVDQCCLSYLILDNLLRDLHDLSEDKRPDSIYMEFVAKLHKTVESRLVLRVAMATKCQAWKSLSPEMQSNIMQLGFFNPFDTNSVKKGPASNNKSPSEAKANRSQSFNRSSATRVPASSSRIQEGSVNPHSRSAGATGVRNRTPIEPPNSLSNRGPSSAQSNGRTNPQNPPPRVSSQPNPAPRTTRNIASNAQRSASVSERR